MAQKALRILICLIVSNSMAQSALSDHVHDLASWSLRFAEKQSIKVATVGCYGTASYGYVLPSVAYVEAYRSTLLGFAGERGLTGFAFTSAKDADNNHVTVDLATGELGSVPPVFNAGMKGVAFCVCRTELTHAVYAQDGRMNCAHSRALRPLGETFLAQKDRDGPVDPAPADEWTDQVTGWRWTFASVASNWFDAVAGCADLGELPDQPTLAHAARRMWDSPLGLRIRAADSRRVWSSDEFDDYAAMAVYLPGGDAGSVDKRALYPVVCVAK